MIDELKALARDEFYDRCYVCRKRTGKYFAFHHLYYKDGDKTHRDFKTSKEYQEFIAPLIRATPYQYRLLCRKHHHLVTMFQRFKPDNCRRMLMLIEDSVVL